MPPTRTGNPEPSRSLVGDGEVDAAIEKYRNEQQQARTLHLSNSPAVNGRADFFVLLSPGQGTTVTVESTSFVSGDENLKVLADSLRSAKFTQQFPTTRRLRLFGVALSTAKPQPNAPSSWPFLWMFKSVN